MDLGKGKREGRREGGGWGEDKGEEEEERGKKRKRVQLCGEDNELAKGCGKYAVRMLHTHDRHKCN